MPERFDRVRFVLRHPLRFLGRVASGFRANQGFLLAGAVAYYTLLSIVPLLALLLVALSQLVAPHELVATLHALLGFVAPGPAEALAAQIAAFLGNWTLVGVAGLLMLLFFSSFAFSAFESAMAVIFHHRLIDRRRHPLVSAVLPYLYMLMLGLGLLTVTALGAGLHALEGRLAAWLGAAGSATFMARVLGLLGEVLLFTSLYLLMPVGRLALRQALVGGVAAALLWELTRQFLVWYFSTLSFVNVIYGAFAAAIVILLSLEAAALILLLGAQVIAEYERIGTRPGTSRPFGAGARPQRRRGTSRR